MVHLITKIYHRREVFFYNFKRNMAGGAAGGFINRAFESMLKECSNKKNVALQTAIQTYIGSYLFFLSVCARGRTSDLVNSMPSVRSPSYLCISLCQFQPLCVF